MLPCRGEIGPERVASRLTMKKWIPELPPVVFPEVEADAAFQLRLAAALDSRGRGDAAALARIAIQERIDASFPPYLGEADGYRLYEFHRECLEDVLTHLVRSFGLLP